MFAAIVAFFVSAAVTLLVIRTARLHGSLSADNDLSAPQRMHKKVVPRVGGLGVAIGVAAGLGALHWRFGDAASAFVLILMACSAPALLAGLAEDLTKRVGPLWRLLATMASAVLAVIFLDAFVPRLDVPWFDAVMRYKVAVDLASSMSIGNVWSGQLSFAPVAIVFTIVVVAGVANAINIVDGLNGLASMVCAMMFASIAYVAFRVNDATVLALSLGMMGAIAGFFLFNFPAGLIFLGDGGAYFLGFMLAETTVLLIARNPEVSAWYAALLLIYPVWETIFSIYRRRFLRKTNPSLPDAVHLHTLVFRRIMRWAVGLEEAKQFTRNNSLSSPFLWVLSAMAVFPATVLWRHTVWLCLLVLMFCGTYVWLYARLVTFRTPRWMRLRKSKPKTGGR